ncbi:1280_t:CDS:2 [Gigaspora margarita]|uniref:1280_t:CDS:1 n=1 Tax=Gigaspora margarita TaxID=4874 RepID=A0ABM8W732_GIGMA|nr:1280_t:CDS:2 [Gigaspora margarita]
MSTSNCSFHLSNVHGITEDQGKNINDTELIIIPHNEPCQIQLCQYLADWIITDSQPLTILENPAFKKFITELDPKFKIPCIKFIKKLVHIITRSNITCSYLDYNFRFHETTLSIEHIHTAENIGDNIFSLLDELELLTMNPIMLHIIDMLKPVSISPEEINLESIKDIFAELEIYDDDKKVKEMLYQAMHFYWKKDNAESYLSSILNPRVKKFDFMPEKFKQAQKLLSIKYNENPTLLNIFNNPSTLNLQSELDEYLAAPQIPFESDPFAWWNMNKERFPVISK